MSASKTRAGSPKRGAGSSSSNGRAKTFKFRGVELLAPKTLPATLAFDIGDIQVRAAEGEMDGVMMRMHRVLEEILGPDELAKVRTTVKGMGDPWQKELLEAVTSLKGLDLGEA